MSASGPEVISTDSEVQAELRALTRGIVRDNAGPERVRALDEAEQFDDELYVALGRAGLIGLGADAATSEDADPRHEIVVLEELAAGPTSMAVCFVVQYMGVRLLTSFGTAEQRDEVLQPMLAGGGRIAFALSEPDGGTDVARVMRTRAERSGAGWVLDGTKTWISGARTAQYAIALARTGPAEPAAIDGITMFLLRLDTPGVTVRELDTLGIHGLDTCEVRFEQVRLGAGSVLGRDGRGFRQVLATLNEERLNAAAAALGIARGALVAAVEYGQQRRAFGRAVASFQALQHRLVDGAVQVEAARGLLNRAAEAEASGAAADVLSAMAKIAASDAATAVTDDGMRLMGGAGFSREFPMQRFFRDARLYTFAPLTNEMLRNYVGERWLSLPRSY